MAGYGKHGYIDFRKLWILLETKEKNKQWLRNNGLHANTVSKLVKNENVTCEVISHLCYLLECNPEDILEYVPDTETRVD